MTTQLRLHGFKMIGFSSSIHVTFVMDLSSCITWN